MLVTINSKGINLKLISIFYRIIINERPYVKFLDQGEDICSHSNYEIKKRNEGGI